MKRLHVLACATTVALALLSGTAAAKPKKPAVLPVVPGSQYLALGDSVTFGYVESNVTPPPNYFSARSFIGYPELLRAGLHLRVANASCEGETSASLINAHAPANGCENRPNRGLVWRPTHPLHVSYKGSQLAYAVSYLRRHHDVRLVSLMIGANDYFVCSVTTKDGCTSSSDLRALTAAVEKNVRTILSAIRNKAHYRGQLVIVNYYSLNYASAPTNAITQYLNRNQDTAAKPFHVEIANGYGTFAAAAAHSGGNSCTAGLLTQTGGGHCGIHPSYAGQALLALAVEKAIKLG